MRGSLLVALGRELLQLETWPFEYPLAPRTHVFAEAADCEIYAFIPGVALQSGLRFQLTETLQVDGNVGRGVTGDPLLPLWRSLGLTAVIDGK